MTYVELYNLLETYRTTKTLSLEDTVTVALVRGAEEVGTHAVDCVNVVHPGHQCDGILDDNHLVLMVNLDKETT